MENLLVNIGRFADIDTRRHLGLPPGKLGPSNFVPRPIPPVTWRYWPAEEKAMYLCFYPGDYEYEVYTGLYTEDGVHFKGREGARHFNVWERRGKYQFSDSPLVCDWGFQFAQIPQTIVNVTAARTDADANRRPDQ